MISHRAAAFRGCANLGRSASLLSDCYTGGRVLELHAGAVTCSIGRAACQTQKMESIQGCVFICETRSRTYERGLRALALCMSRI